MNTSHTPRGPKQIIITLLCALVIAFSAVSIFRTASGPRGGNSVNLVTSYGRIVADEMATIIPLSARILVLSVESHYNPGLQQIATRFTHALQECGFTQVSEMVLHGEEIMPTVMVDGHELSGAVFERVLSQHPDAEVIVSLAGTPPADNGTLRHFRNDSKTLVLAGNIARGATLNRWLQSDAVALTVLPHNAPIHDRIKPPETEREVFDFYFDMQTTRSTR